MSNQNSAFLNYKFDYLKIKGRKSFYLYHELGIRSGSFTFLTSGSYSSTLGKYIRLSSGIYMDNRENLNRLILGDFITPAGPTTFGNPIAGISYFRNFRIDPYFIYTPTFDIKALIPYRSEVEVYLDDVLIKREIVPPGELNLADIRYYGGRRDLKILIKDTFGRIQEITYPLYFTDQMLEEGVREFNYSIGFLREDFTANRYTHLRLFAFERYGYSPYLNFGGQVTAIPGKEFYNLSGEAKTLLKYYGVLSFLASYSYLKSQKGYALMSSYSYTQKNLGFRASGFYASEDYTENYYQAKVPRERLSLGASYFIPILGSFSIDMVKSRFKDEEKKFINFTYNRSFLGRLNFFLTFTKHFGKDRSYSFFVGMNLYPQRDHILSTYHQDILEEQSQSFQVSKLPPLGEGYSYRISIDRTDLGSTVSPYLQYRSRYGVMEIDGRLRGVLESIRLAYSGSIAYVEDQLVLTRPVLDSFGIIKAGDIPGVLVNLNGQPIGRTNKKGLVALPELSSYYHNNITINDKDIPLDYDIQRKEVNISPWFKSGFCVDFSVEKVYRYSGYLVAYYIATGQRKPLEFYEITVEIPSEKKADRSKCLKLVERRVEKEVKVQTGKNGELYLEGLNPGVYKAKVVIDGRVEYFELTLPESKDIVHDIGKIEIPIK